MSLPIYFDNNATTPLDPRVLEAMEVYFREDFGNPSSAHEYGWSAKKAVTLARRQVAKSLNTKPMNIYFTSGATESNNMVLQGLVLKYVLAPGNTFRPHVITTNVEHKCILEACGRIEALGADITLLEADANGCVSSQQVAQAIRPETRLVSVIFANNEIGSINPIGEIGDLCKSHGILFHTDAAQAFGKNCVDVEAMSIDFLSLSGHKIYGPKGIGALYCRKGVEAFLEPLIVGGAQERGLRSGTHNVSGIVGLGAAVVEAERVRSDEQTRLVNLRSKVIEALKPAFPNLIINGHSERFLCGNLSLTFPGIESQYFTEKLQDLAYSRSSACSSGAFKPSYVLKAIGHSDDLAASTIRLGLGRFTSDSEVEEAIAKILSMAAAVI